jgi:hypothetical protein
MRPRIPSRQNSLFALEYAPPPQNVLPLFSHFTQRKPKVLKQKPHASIIGTTGFRFGHVPHMKSAAFFAAMRATGRR